MTLPAEVHTAARFNALRAGIDHDDALSFTAEAWASHPDYWRTVAHRRCVDQRRRVSGRDGADRADLAILDEPMGSDPDNDRARGDLLAIEVDPGIAEVEARVDLAAVLGPLPDEDVATLARVYWLGMAPEQHNGNPVALDRARRHAKAQAVANAIRAGKRLAIVPPPAPACPLTARELEVVALAADGLTRAAIGSRLGLATYTIKSHLGRITKRLNAQDTTHVVAMSLRAGWIT